MRALPTFATCLLLSTSLAAAEQDAASPIVLRVGFDGNCRAALRGRSIEPQNTETKVELRPGLQTQAALLSDGRRLEFDLGRNFPSDAGSLEIRFRPDFPQSPEQASRTIVSLAGKTDARIDFGFVPQGVRWQFTVASGKWRRSFAASNFDDEDRSRWTQLILTWDKRARSGAVCRLYRDGKFDRHRTEAFDGDLTGISRLTIGGDGDLSTLIDELVLYDHALDDDSVDFLHSAAADGDRLVKLVERRQAAADEITAERAAHQALIAKLEGNVAYLINPRGGQIRNYRLPGGIMAVGVRVEDVGKLSLERFAVIYGPPGAGYQLTKDQDEIIRKFIADGGGYVGVCAGANYAGRAKLLDMKTHSLKNQGLVTIGIEPHRVTEGFAGEVLMHHGNGPVMIPGPGCQAIGSFLFGQNFPLKTAAIVAGTLGKGRVVAFGPHPTGGNVEFQAKGVKFPGAELGTDALLVNALLWAARIVD